MKEKNKGWEVGEVGKNKDHIEFTKISEPYFFYIFFILDLEFKRYTSFMCTNFNWSFRRCIFYTISS